MQFHLQGFHPETQSRATGNIADLLLYISDDNHDRNDDSDNDNDQHYDIMIVLMITGDIGDLLLYSKGRVNLL